LKLKKIIAYLSGTVFLLTALGSASYYWLVVVHPGEQIRQANIEKILAMESPVFYNDGQSMVGVFFKEAHRQYIPYNEIPKDFINAIVAAEDHTFFSHVGVDFLGVLRALYANVKAGRIVQGGSTITQQTAKNLFKRKDRSLRSKLKELLFALQLEYHYSKEKIIEFYANQFYVSGNGHGLGVAARYYFDKQVSELNTLECAFIAGSVKRPSSYNPFIKENEDAARMARMRAKNRTNYVLGQMRKLGFLTEEQLNTLLEDDIAFNQGKTFYQLNTIMDMVKWALNEPEVEEALAQHGIDNIATSGIRIITTIDKILQEKALYALHKELSRLDVRLRGYERQEVQDAYNKLSHAGVGEIRPGSFIFGTITEIENFNGPQISVSFGDKEKDGRLNTAGLMPLLNSLIKWQKQRWSEADQFDLPLLLDQLQVGDKVFVSVRSIDPGSGEYLLDLEKYPEIQGGAIALKNGTIQLLIGGMENHFFNRAVSAKRPMGSVMKPLVYAAALQLGWNNLDALNNKRDLFVYQSLPYFPRPDHFSPYAQVSMSWAGVHSENLATVWLLYHLCDQLTPGQFKDLTAHLGLDRGADESYERYKRRIRDEFGIIVDRDALYRAAFKIAVKELQTDLIFAGKLKEYDLLKRLHYGLNFDEYLADVENLSGPTYETEERQQQVIEKEMKVRKNILKWNFLNFILLRQELQELKKDYSVYDSGRLKGNLYYIQQSDTYIYSADIFDDDEPAPDGWHRIDQIELAEIIRQLLQGEKPAVADALWGPIIFEEQLLPKSTQLLNSESLNEFWDSILIEGMLSPPTIDLLSSSVEKEFERLAALPPYNAQVLHNIDDFRVTAGLIYLTSLGKALGIRSTLDPVLSFPLGSNVITPLETARMYEAIVTGSIQTDAKGEIRDELAIIDRIEDSDGELIYRPERTTKTIFDPKTTLVVNNILRNVIKFGTGQYARDHVKLRSRIPEREKQFEQLDLLIPISGKTGTANRFTNSAFAGYIPGPDPEGDGVTVDGGYSAAAYVGFDDNTPMVRTSTHITGASGALHVWSRITDSILLEKDYGSGLDLVDIMFTAAPVNGRPELPLLEPRIGQIEVEVNKTNGLIFSGNHADEAQTQNTSTAIITTFGERTRNGDFSPLRYFRPYWSHGDSLYK